MGPFPRKHEDTLPITHAIFLLMLFSISLFLRIVLPYDDIFTESGVIFRGTEPWYHMRLVENMLHHFPHMISFDPYTFYPYGAEVGLASLFDFSVALVAWIVGLGNPGPQTIESVGAYFPAVLGALILFPVYMLGKAFFNRNAGIISAALMSVLPGEFLVRSLLGYTVSQGAEVLLSAVTVLFLARALVGSSSGVFGLGQLFAEDRNGFKKTVIYGFLAGITLSLYLLTWSRGLLFVLILFCYLMAQAVINHLKKRSNDRLGLIMVITFLAPLIVIALFPHRGALSQLHVPVLVICAAVSLAICATSRLMIGRLPGPYYLVAIGGLGVLMIGLLYFIQPGLLKSLFNFFVLILPIETKIAVEESQPLLRDTGIISLPLVMWHYFTTTFLVAAVSLVWLFYAVGKEGRPDRTLLLVWSFMMLIAMVVERRFAAYFAVNVSLLSGHVCGKMIEWSGLGREGPKVEGRTRPSGARMRQIIAVALVILVAFFPNLRASMALAKDSVLFTRMPHDWYGSLQWMKANTPDPFNDPEFYYARYRPPRKGQHYPYPPGAYGVMTWWAYGNWLTYVAHRIPNASPSGMRGARQAESFFTAQSEAQANKILDRAGSKYVVADRRMGTTVFDPMADRAREAENEFFEVYYERMAGGKLRPVILYYPAYYRAMCSRLYHFEGQAVVPDHTTWVVSFRVKSDNRGHGYKEIDTLRLFPTFEEARDLVEKENGAHLRIVGENPLVSPVPLEALRTYRKIHASPPVAVGGKEISHVKIFEYAGSKK